MARNDIYLAAKECIGTPFKHQGRVKGVGMDCVGVAAYALSKVGYAIQEVQGYGRRPNAGMLKSAIEAHSFLTRADAGDIQPGDVLLMRFGEDPQHVAIAGSGTIVHAYAQVRKCCEHRLTDEWKGRIDGVYRVAA